MTGEPLFSREKVDSILSLIPKEARCCYTGQSILAYCPTPTFDWAEVNSWPDETDVDIFVYSKAGLASLIQVFLDRGWEPASEIDRFKSERIRFWEAPKKYANTLQTIGLTLGGMPTVNLTWYNESTDVVNVVKRFDMDYLCVGMDIRTREFVDFRGPDHRIANVNKLNVKFDVSDVDAMFWVRQFDRCPKGWARGIDTRPVAKTYAKWLNETLDRGDWAAGSKTRYYADRRMDQVLEGLLDAGIEKAPAEAIYHLVRGEDHSWEAMRLQYEMMLTTISDWLTSVEND